MSYSEAVESVGRLIAAFPNGSPANAKGYIGALAAVLVDYPRVVAAKCSDPLKGVARETRFLPTVADLVGWCEREKAALQGIVDREDAERATLKARETHAQQQQKWAEDRKTRPTYDELIAGVAKQHGMSAIEKEDLVVRQANLASIEKGNRRAFERECKAAGVDPARMTVSPSLVRVLSRDAQDAEDRMRRAEALGRQADKLDAEQNA